MLSMTWEELITEFCLDRTIKGYAPDTIKSYSFHLKKIAKYFENLGIEPLDVTKKDVKNLLLNYKERGLQHSTINTLISRIKRLFDFAVEEGYAEENPAIMSRLREQKKLIYPLNDDEIKQILAAAKSHEYPLLRSRNTLIFMLLLDCGLRISEVVKLSNDDILTNQIMVRDAKFKKDRAVALSPVVKKEIIKYQRVKRQCGLGIETDSLLVTYEDKRMSKENIWQIMHKLKDQVKIRKEVRFSPHTLRYTYAAMQLRNGLDIYTLSLNMGHHDIKITEEYIRTLKSDDFIDRSIQTSTLMNLK